MTDSSKRPTLLAVLVPIIAALSLMLLIPIYIAIFATPDSTFQIIGESMLMQDVRFELLVSLIVFLSLMIYVGLGLWRGISLARHVFFSALVVILLVETLARQAFIELPLVVLVSGLAAWYFYVKRNVKKFFEGT